MSERLQVRVSEDLVLDAGTAETSASGVLIHPPSPSMFHQVIAYLDAKPDPGGRAPKTRTGRQGIAAAAVILRWGTYLAVLLDKSMPVTPAVQNDSTSRICDDEVARINLEASSALAEWIDLSRDPSAAARFASLEDRALAYLPMPVKPARPMKALWPILAERDMSARIVSASAAEVVTRVRADAERYPTRLLANALVNVGWRNGPVEDVHAGMDARLRLDERRFTPSEEHDSLRQVADTLELGMAVCSLWSTESPRRPWVEQVLPFGLVPFWQVTPTGWSLTEGARRVQLPP